MASFKNKLETLKNMLISEDDFGETFNYFFGQLGEDQHFIDASKKAKHPLLKTVLKFIGKNIFKDDVKIHHMMLLKFSPSRFYHGSCFIHNKPATIFFFEDIDMGMVALSLAGFAPGEVRFVRFSSTILHDHPLSDKPDGMKITYN